MSPGPPDLSFSHVGICVSDIDRSLRFYCDGLGFEKNETYEVGNEFAATLEVDGDVQVRSQFIRRDGMTIELLHYTSPGTTGQPSQHRNQLGMTHLSFNVSDVDAVAARLVECGGAIVESTRTKGPAGYLLFCADPDGTRVELMKLG